MVTSWICSLGPAYEEDSELRFEFRAGSNVSRERLSLADSPFTHSCLYELEPKIVGSNPTGPASMNPHFLAIISLFGGKEQRLSGKKRRLA